MNKKARLKHTASQTRTNKHIQAHPCLAANNIDVQDKTHQTCAIAKAAGTARTEQ